MNSSRALRVLLVEDHADTAESLATLLRLEGHHVDVAADGMTALRIAQAGPPDVALLDIGLPGMDGHQVAQGLRALRHDKRPLLIATTGYGTDEDKRRSDAAGLDLHLVKPVDLEQLRSLLKRFHDIVE